MVDPLGYFSFQPVLHDWCAKGRDLYYHLCGITHLKETLLLIGKSNPYGCSGFPLSLSEWSFTILCLTPYNRKQHVMSESLDLSEVMFFVCVFFLSFFLLCCFVFVLLFCCAAGDFSLVISLSQWSFTIIYDQRHITVNKMC